MKFRVVFVILGFLLIPTIAPADVDYGDDDDDSDAFSCEGLCQRALEGCVPTCMTTGICEDYCYENFDQAHLECLNYTECDTYQDCVCGEGYPQGDDEGDDDDNNDNDDDACGCGISKGTASASLTLLMFAIGMMALGLSLRSSRKES